VRQVANLIVNHVTATRVDPILGNAPLNQFHCAFAEDTGFTYFEGERMRISVFGLGYVGVVSSACLAKDGRTVIGVDPNLTKVDLVNSGRAPIVEAEVEELVAEAVENGPLNDRYW